MISFDIGNLITMSKIKKITKGRKQVRVGKVIIDLEFSSLLYFLGFSKLIKTFGSKVIRRETHLITFVLFCFFMKHLKVNKKRN